MTEHFEKQDKGWMEYFKPAREKKVPRETLMRFSDDVMEKIEKRAGPAWRPAPMWRLVPVLVPVAAVLVLAVTLTLKPAPDPVPFVNGDTLAHAPTAPNVSPSFSGTGSEAAVIAMDEDILEDIEILRELGEWSDEDEGNGETAAEDLAVLEPEVS